MAANGSASTKPEHEAIAPPRAPLAVRVFAEVTIAAGLLIWVAPVLWLGDVLQHYAPAIAVMATIALVAMRRDRLHGFLLVIGLIGIAVPYWRSGAPAPAAEPGQQAITMAWTLAGEAAPAELPDDLDAWVHFGAGSHPAPSGFARGGHHRFTMAVGEAAPIQSKSLLPMIAWQRLVDAESQAVIHQGAWENSGWPLVHVFVVRHQPGSTPADFRSDANWLDRLAKAVEGVEGPVVVVIAGGMTTIGGRWQRLAGAGLQRVAGADQWRPLQVGKRFWAVRGLAVSQARVYGLRLLRFAPATVSPPGGGGA